MTKKILFTETVLRDGQQSQIATRMPTSDMLPILETMDQSGFHALEVWGGATFVKGFYGKTPVAISEAMQKKIIGNEPVTTERPADLLPPELPKYAGKIQQYAKNEEDVLMYASFPQQAKDFLGRREDRFYDVPLQEVEVTIDL